MYVTEKCHQINVTKFLQFGPAQLKFQSAINLISHTSSAFLSGKDISGSPISKNKTTTAISVADCIRYHVTSVRAIQRWICRASNCCQARWKIIWNI